VTEWESMLESSLQDGDVDFRLEKYLDEILSWSLRRRDHSYLLLQEKFGGVALLKLIEVFLDKLILSDSSNYEIFPLNLSVSQTKKRYRQLIRIFHPDRGTNSQEWLNSCAEKINKAYQNYNNNVDLIGEVSSSSFNDGSLVILSSFSVSFYSRYYFALCF